MKFLQKTKYFTGGLVTALVILAAGILYAQPTTNDLMGVGMPAALANVIGGNADYDLIPSADDTYDLGTAALEWQDAFFDGTITSDILINSGASTLTGAVGFGSTIIGTGTSTIGWTVQSGANTACTTTCTTPCVMGWDTSGTQSTIVDCAGATADECLCAGAS